MESSEMITPELRDKVLAGRNAVTAYRLAHSALHDKPAYKGVHDDHTTIFAMMESELAQGGFKDVGDFFNQSDEMSIRELGFKDRADFEVKAKEKDRIDLEEKWR